MIDLKKKKEQWIVCAKTFWDGSIAWIKAKKYVELKDAVKYFNCKKNEFTDLDGINDDDSNITIKIFCKGDNRKLVIYDNADVENEVLATIELKKIA